MGFSQDRILKRGSPLWLAVTGMLTAMNIVLSMSIFSIPVPGGHLYFCDVIINTAAMLLDPFAAFLVGGVGSFFGDMLFYPAPMFVSLVSHGLQAVAVSILARPEGEKRPLIHSGLAVSAGTVIMVIGYTLGRAFVYATPETAMLKLPFECVQGVFGAVVSIVLCYPLKLKEIFARMILSAR